ncbi:MAG: restriction endonuclease subunit S [Pseudomonadota bacterium]
MIPTTDIVANGTPTGWRTVPFWSLFRREKKTGFPEEELLSVYRDYGVIPKSSRDDNHNKESEDLSGYQLVTEGALVTNKMKAWQGSIAISRYQGIVSPAYYVYTPQSKEWDQFLHYLLRSDPYIGLYGRISKGVRVNQWDLEHEALRNIPVLLPDLATQRQIADFLDRETARIDLLIEKKQRLVALLGEKWNAQISRAIAVDRHPSHRLKHLIRIGSSISYGIVQPGDPVDEGVPFIQTANLVQRRLDRDELPRTLPEIAAKYPRSKLSPGDVLLGIRASIGQSVVVGEDLDGANLSRGIAKITPSNTVMPEFLCLVLESKETAEFWTQVQQGTTFREISIESVRELPVPVPEFVVQEKICRDVRNMRACYEKLLSKNERSIDRLKEYRSALITAAVTGQIDVKTYTKSGTPDRRLDAIQEEIGA